MSFDDSVNENKGILKKHADVWDGIKYEIKETNGGKKNDYQKDWLAIKQTTKISCNDQNYQICFWRRW